MTDFAAMIAALPQERPFLFVDGVESVERGVRVVGWVEFAPDHPVFDGHLPGRPLVPGVILCEVGMQAGAILLSGVPSDGGVPVATHLNEVRFRKMIRPGDTLQIEVELIERVAHAFFMKAKITREGATVVRFQFTCTMAEPHRDDPS